MEDKYLAIDKLNFFGLYVGREIIVNKKSYYLKGVSLYGTVEAIDEINFVALSALKSYRFSIEDCKLCLRKVEDLTPKELKTFNDIFHYAGYRFIDKIIVDKQIMFSPKCMAYLISRGIDVFGLIEAGIAIHKKGEF